ISSTPLAGCNHRPAAVDRSSADAATATSPTFCATGPVPGRGNKNQARAANCKASGTMHQICEAGEMIVRPITGSLGGSVAPGGSIGRLLLIGLAVVDVAVGMRRRAIALLHAALGGIPAPVCPVVGIRFEDVIHIARVDFATRDLAEEME